MIGVVSPNGKKPRPPARPAGGAGAGRGGGVGM